ncbi:hypothetical protein Tco_0221895 [Tanacetum coccineum]
MTHGLSIKCCGSSKASGQALTEEEIAFLADPGLPDAQNSQTVITNNAAYQADDLDAYDSDCDELNSARLFSGNLSRNGSDALTEVHNQDNLNYDLFNQSEQIMTSSEHSNDVSQSETDIISDSNIIPYSQYLSETHIQELGLSGTVHMMTKSKICYDHSSKQALGFEKPFCLKKARESMPKLYDGNTILKMDPIVVPDSDETIESY